MKKWRERERKWRENEEMERERFSPSPCLLFLVIFSLYRSISSPFSLHFLILSPFSLTLKYVLCVLWTVFSKIEEMADDMCHSDDLLMPNSQNKDVCCFLLADSIYGIRVLRNYS